MCCCFRSIRLKNKSVKCLDNLTRKLPKVRNQHMMTCFCTQTILTSFFDILLLFPVNMVEKCLEEKVHNPKLENLPKIETNPRLLHFSPKSFAHNFRSFCCCFQSIQLKNKSAKSLDHLTRKLLKVRNQHMMTCFCTQTILTSFFVILLLFPMNMFKKCSKQKYTTLNSKTWQK